jgi:Tfp pilus assembly protein PilV
MLRNGQTGVSMIEALVAAALLGIVMVAIASGLGTNFRAQKAIDTRGNLDTIRQNLLHQLSCGQTLPSATCTANNAVALKDAAGAVFLDSTSAPVAFGSWKVQAACNSAGNGLKVQASRRSSGGTVLNDQMTGAAQDWADVYPTDLCVGVASDNCDWYSTIRSYADGSGWGSMTANNPALSVSYSYQTPSGSGAGNPYATGTVADQPPFVWNGMATYSYTVTCPANKVVHAGGCRADWGANNARLRNNSPWGAASWYCSWDHVQGWSAGFSVDFIVTILCCQV